jgi:hypothetical protein
LLPHQFLTFQAEFLFLKTFIYAPLTGGAIRLEKNQISLSVDDLPKEWYNILPDLLEPLPPPKEPEEGPSRLEFLGRTGFPYLRR